MYYTEPKLKSYGGDLNKRWRVEWYQSDNPIVRKDSRTLKIRYLPTSAKTSKQRHEAAKTIIAQVCKQIENSRIKTDEGTLIEYLDKACTYTQQNCTSDGSRRCFQYSVLSLKKYLNDTGKQNFLPMQFDRATASDFMKHTYLSKKITNRTINGYLSYVRPLFQYLVDNDVIQYNPFDRIKKLRTQEVEVRLWTKDERQTFAAYAQENDQAMYMAALFTYHCFMRQNEVLQIQIKDIDLSRGVVYVSASKGKSNRHKYPTLSNRLIELLTPIVNEYRKYPNYYLFSTDPLMKPGIARLGKKYLADRFSRLRDRAELPSDLKLYALKHTGNSLMLEKGASIEELRQQNGHSETRTTEIYIRRLTIKANDRFKQCEDL